MKLLDVIKKADMDINGYCKDCPLQWIDYGPEDIDFGCTMDKHVQFMIGKKECIYPRFLKESIRGKQLKEIEEFYSRFD